MFRTHTCGELRKEHDTHEMTLAGWVHRRRDHGPLIFLDLRDRYGITQVVFDSSTTPESHAIASDVRSEFVLQVRGVVRLRPEDAINHDLSTGEIEVVGQDVTILNASLTPPLMISRDGGEEESLRLKYRYLDLRRERMQRNLVLRHRIVKYMRDFLDDQAFVEIETPILIKSTPEGARDYLVPSRIHPGKCYALPQSPQQLKQMLMVSGYDRYFQIARCFRDEDQRADRQPEFTQLDLEMSFVEREDIMSLMEQMFIQLVQTISPDKSFHAPFTRLTYAEAINRYGTDKPDLRYGMELGDLSALLTNTEFKVFRGALESGGQVKGICVPGRGDYSRKQLDELIEIAKGAGAKGLAWLALAPDQPLPTAASKARASFARFVTDEELQGIISTLGAQAGDLVLLVADRPMVVAAVLDKLRREFALRLNLLDSDSLAFVWVTDFPLLEWNDDEKRWDAMHHPFTAPMDDDLPHFRENPGNVRAKAYDLVLNGYELGGGSIRIYQKEMQQTMLHLLGINDEVAQERFGHMLEAFEYGAPPHGGIAFGIDRLAMILSNETTIREVMAFPKTQQAIDVMTDAPSVVDEQQLRDLHIKFRT